MGDRRLRMTVIAEIVGAVLMGLFLIIDLLEQPTRIAVPVGALILLLIVAAMIVVGVIGLRR